MTTDEHIQELIYDLTSNFELRRMRQNRHGGIQIKQVRNRQYRNGGTFRVKISMRAACDWQGYSTAEAIIWNSVTALKCRLEHEGHRVVLRNDFEIQSFVAHIDLTVAYCQTNTLASMAGEAIAWYTTDARQEDLEGIAP